MGFHQYDRLGFYFGDAHDQLYPEQYKQWHEVELEAHPPIAKLMRECALDRILFLNQTHSIKGVLVTPTNSRTIAPFSMEGDFLITSMPHVGLGVVTADCLPVICIDSRHQVIGIAHAGWRGAVAGVVPQMLDAMCKQRVGKTEDIQVFLGPSARSCCYEVDASFGAHVAPYPCVSDVLRQREGSWYFDLPGFVRQQLAVYGIAKSSISEAYAGCTICDPRFFSHRRAMRLGERDGRQMSVVVLRETIEPCDYL